MRETIAIINEKGGVSKTTTASALAAGFLLNGLKVLSIDLDTQGNLSHIMGADESGPTIVDVLTEKLAASEAIQHTGQGDIISASPALARIEHLITGKGKERRLQTALEPIRENYDTIILDLPPGLTIITIMALTAITSAIIPVTADILSVKGLAQLYQIVESVRENSNPSLRIMGILLTRYNGRSVLRRDMASVIRDTAQRIGTKVFETTIREAVAIGEAQAQQQDIFHYDSKANVTADYKALVEEVISDMKLHSSKKGD